MNRTFAALLVFGVLGCSSSETPDDATPSATPSAKPSAPSAKPASKLPALPSPEEGKNNIAKGLAAVQAGEFSLAVRYFTEARKADPYAPELLFNLGLAHSRAGNEILAIPWLETYLASAPSAQNAPAVRAEITRLEAGASAKITKMVEKARAMAEGLANPEERKSVLDNLMWRQAETGNVEAAVNTYKVRSGDDGTGWAPVAWRVYGERLAAAGDVPRALEIAARLPERQAEDVHRKCIERLGNSGRIPEMIKIVEQAPAASQDRLRQETRRYVVRHYFQKKEMIAIEELLPKLVDHARDEELSSMVKSLALGERETARKFADLIKDRDRKAGALRDLALACLRSGDVATAQAIARELLPLVGALRGYSSAIRLQLTTAAILGNVEVAAALTQKLRNPEGFVFDENFVPPEYGLVVEIRYLCGDQKGAEALIGQFNRFPVDAGYKVYSGGQPERGMAAALILKGQPQKAFEYYRKTKSRHQAELLMDLVGAFVQAGDLSGAERAIWTITPQAYADPHFNFPYSPKADEMLAPVQMNALVKLSEAYQAKNLPEDAKRLLRDAVVIARAYRRTDFSGDWLTRVAELQRNLGDDAGAQETKAFSPPSGSEAWIQIARRISSSELATLEEALRSRMKEKKPGEVPGVLASVSTEMADIVFELHGLRESR